MNYKREEVKSFETESNRVVLERRKMDLKYSPVEYVVLTFENGTCVRGETFSELLPALGYYDSTVEWLNRRTKK